MKISSGQLSQRTAAGIAGFGLLLMTILAIFALPLVFQNLISPGDAAATMNNIMSHEQLFRMGIVSLILIVFLDIFVALALYLFFRNVDSGVSLLTAWFRLVYSILFAAAIVYYLDVLQLLSGDSYLVALNPDLLHTQVMLSVNSFNDGWALAFIFFGFHLALLGYLVMNSDFIPKIIGALVSIAGISYLVDYFGRFLYPDMDWIFSTIFGWGELIFMIWLIFYSVKKPNITGENLKGG